MVTVVTSLAVFVLAIRAAGGAEDFYGWGLAVALFVTATLMLRCRSIETRHLALVDENIRTLNRVRELESARAEEPTRRG